VVSLKSAREAGGSEQEEVDYKQLYLAYVRELRNSAADMKDVLAMQDHYLNKLHLPPSITSLHNIKLVSVGSNAVLLPNNAFLLIIIIIIIIIIIHLLGVGSLLIRFTANEFPADYVPTGDRPLLGQKQFFFFFAHVSFTLSSV
jgi:hypothetical protein